MDLLQKLRVYAIFFFIIYMWILLFNKTYRWKDACLKVISAEFTCIEVFMIFYCTFMYSNIYLKFN